MKASLETSALFLSTTLELKNFVSPDLKFHCFLLPNFRSKDSSRIFSDLETMAINVEINVSLVGQLTMSHLKGELLLPLFQIRLARVNSWKMVPFHVITPGFVFWAKPTLNFLSRLSRSWSHHWVVFS